MTNRTRCITHVTAGTHFNNGDGAFVAATDAAPDHVDSQLVLMAVRVVSPWDGTLAVNPVLYKADKTQHVEVLPDYVPPRTI